MKTWIIYTDGSHFKGKGNGRLGIGGVIVDPTSGVIHGTAKGSFSIEILPSFMQLHYGTSDTSNPTMEILGALQSLEEFKNVYKNDDLIIMRQDYIGVSQWVTEKWKINKPYIKKIKDEITEFIRKNNLNIKWEWVKGHQTATTDEAYWNNIVDKLAKGEIKSI